MGFLDSAIARIFSSPPEDPNAKSPKLLVTPCPSRSTLPKFHLPSADYSSSSSSSASASSASLFWQSPRPLSRWSPRRYIPARIRGSVTKRQVAVIVCIALTLLIWVVPPPQTWRQRVVHITLPQPGSSPYQVLRPVSIGANKHAPDPLRWLEHNSNNKHNVANKPKLLASLTSIGHVSTRPRAALISLVRNSELPGLMQSMRQLEFHWNRKYQYPWIFFNDEPFSDEFKVGHCTIQIYHANNGLASYAEPHCSQMLLRSCAK